MYWQARGRRFESAMLQQKTEFRISACGSALSFPVRSGNSSSTTSACATTNAGTSSIAHLTGRIEHDRRTFSAKACRRKNSRRSPLCRREAGEKPVSLEMGITVVDEVVVSSAHWRPVVRRRPAAISRLHIQANLDLAPRTIEAYARASPII